jgi:hypothetical protein
MRGDRLFADGDSKDTMLALNVQSEGVLRRNHRTLREERQTRAC